MANEPQADLERIQRRIVTLCDSALEQNESYLLSKLGADLGKDAKMLFGITGLKLRQFIQANMSDKYQVVSVVGLPHIFAVVRANGAGGRTIAVVPQATAMPRSEPRYHFRFWAAFSVPSKSTPRYLNPNDMFFKDIATGENPPPNWLLIDEEFIAPPTVSDRDALIKANIEKWLAKNSFDHSDFLQDASKLSRPAAHGNLLGAVLSALDRRQLESASLPLDVVAALFNKRV